MTKFKTAVAIAVGSLFAGAAFAQSNYEIEQRDRMQQARINQGVQSGQLTSREADRLQAERAQVERLERRARADGTLTQNERNRIDHAQDRLGRDIYRESHDRQVANQNGHSSGRHYGWDRGNGNGWGRGNGNGWGRGNDNGRGHNNEQRQFDHRGGVRGERNESHSNATQPRTRTDTHASQSDRFAGRQGNVQQAQTRPAQTQANRQVAVARQAGDSGRRTR